MVIIIATLNARVTMAERVEFELRRLLSVTAEEPGVRSYSIARDPQTAGRFIVVERYVDERAWTEHRDSSHLRAALSRLETQLEGPPEVVVLNEVASLVERDRTQRGQRRLAEVDGALGERLVSELGDLGRYIVEFAFGDIYCRPGLTLHARELLSVALLTVLGREPQLALHLRAGLNVGLSVEELREAILHTVPYAGFPSAINAWRLLDSVLQNDARVES